MFVFAVLVSQGSVAMSSERLEGALKPSLGRAMQESELVMKGLLSAYISGQFDVVARIAARLQSGLLGKPLASEQQKGLKLLYPEGFFKQEARFYQQARQLEQAAVKKQLDLMGFYYYQLVDSCVDCHRRYALERFPQLKNIAKGRGVSH